MRARVIGVGLFLVAVGLMANLAVAQKDWKDVSVQVGDIKVHYIDGGSGDRNLVFVPGMAMTAEVWQGQIPYFAARGFRVMAYDPRGQGLTSKTDGGNDYHQHAADLHAFLEKVKLEHCTLIGWSAGVVTLLEYISSPESLPPDRLVLVDWAPPGLDEKSYPSGLAVQQVRELGLAIGADRPKAIEQRVRGMFKTPPSGPVVKDLIDGSLKTPTGTLMALLFDLITGDRRPALSRVTVPTLIVTSQANQSAGEFLQSKISGSLLKVIPNAGHALFLERPQAFNQALEDFLSK